MILAVNLVCGHVVTTSVLDSAMSRVIDRDVINLAPNFCDVDILVLESVEKRVRPSAECVTMMRSRKSSLDTRMSRTLDLFSSKTASISLRFFVLSILLLFLLITVGYSAMKTSDL